MGGGCDTGDLPGVSCEGEKKGSKTEQKLEALLLRSPDCPKGSVRNRPYLMMKLKQMFVRGFGLDKT